MNTIETSTSLISYNKEEGFLRVVSKPESEIEIEDAKHDFEQAAILTHHEKVPVLADSRNVSYHSREVRDYYASKEVGEKISAMAVLVDSFATRLVGNFFIKTSKPHFPTKLFTNEADAITWLKNFLESKGQVTALKANHSD